MENGNIDEETKRQLRIAEREKKLKDERRQALLLGWVFGGILLAVITEGQLLLSFGTSLILSAIYAFGFHAKR